MTLDSFYKSALLISVTTGASTALLPQGLESEVNRSGALAKAMLIYANDNNGFFPQSMGTRADGNGMWATMYPAPPGVIADSNWTDPFYIRAAGSHWANVIRSYVTKAEHYRDPGQQVVGLPTDFFTPGMKPLAVGLTMNGLLHSYPRSSVDNPGLVPLIWAGNGSVAILGRATTNPVLNCQSAGPCRFNPKGYPQASRHWAGMPAGFFAPFNKFPDGTVWSHRTGERSGGGSIASVDGSARFQIWGTVFAPDQTKSADKDIYAALHYNEDGKQGFAYWATNHPDCTNVSDERTSGEHIYPCYFRPDRTR